VSQEGALSVHPAGVAGQHACRTDHAVTGHHDGERIASYGRTHGPCGGRPADPLRKLLVADRLAVGDPLEFLPHQLLEHGPSHASSQVERGQLAREVRVELGARLGERVVVAHPVLAHVGPALVRGHVDAAQRAVTTDEQ